MVLRIVFLFVVSAVTIATPATSVIFNAVVLSLAGFHVGPMIPFVNVCACDDAPVRAPVASKYWL